MQLYKLTDEYGQTHGGTQWAPGVTHEGSGVGPLCSAGWIHACTDPLLAIFLNPIHGDFRNPRLWECRGEVALSDRGLKVGCKSLTTVREIPLPEVTTEQRVRFAILCAKRVCTDPKWLAWADAWLLGKNRAAADATAARVVIWAAEQAAVWVTRQAAKQAASRAAMWAAEQAEEAARAVAEEAAWAARSAMAAEAEAAKPPDLVTIAVQAIKS